MWSILHFVFMHYCQPSAWMHVIATGIFAGLNQITTKKISLQDFTASVALFGMYIGYYLTKELWHFAYLPWWVVTICGFRKQKTFISLGGVLLGFILHAFDWKIKIGHCLMNISRMLKLDQQSVASLALVHLSLSTVFYFTQDYSTKSWYIDMLAGFSAVIAACFGENISWFSIVMLFTEPLAMGLAFLHALSPFWYDYYKNNHFRMVKYAFYFVYPICILIALWFREELTYIRGLLP